MNDLFYVFGIALTLMAVIVAFVGLRMESFPSRPVMIGTLALMAFLVVGSAAYAISLAREEHEIREAEIFEYRAEQAEEIEEGEEPISEQPTDQEEPIQGGDLALTSPDAGDLIFEPEALEAEAGEVVLTYTNPSEVPHNVAIEFDGEVAQSETVTGGDSADATAELEPGEYVFFCSIPGHRESGMEGTLTVK